MCQRVVPDHLSDVRRSIEVRTELGEIPAEETARKDREVGVEAETGVETKEAREEDQDLHLEEEMEGGVEGDPGAQAAVDLMTIQSK